MKKKAALLLAILVLGAMMAACGQSGTSEPAPTATPEAAEEPAASPEPASSPESQQVNQEAEGQNTSDESGSYEAESSADYETLVSEIMTEFGFSREKAEEIVQKGLQEESERSQTIEERQEEEAIRMEQERQQAHEERDKFCWENYGTSADHWDSMTFEEKGAWMEAHPMN